MKTMKKWICVFISATLLFACSKTELQDNSAKQNVATPATTTTANSVITNSYDINIGPGGLWQKSSLTGDWGPCGLLGGGGCISLGCSHEPMRTYVIPRNQGSKFGPIVLITCRKCRELY